MNAEKMATKEADRIQSLDVIRGFALLGILLLNILIFGLPYSVALLPGLAIESELDLFVRCWLCLFDAVASAFQNQMRQ